MYCLVCDQQRTANGVVASYAYLENLAIWISLENRLYGHRQRRSPLSELLPSQATHSELVNSSA